MANDNRHDPTECDTDADFAIHGKPRKPKLGWRMVISALQAAQSLIFLIMLVFLGLIGIFAFAGGVLNGIGNGIQRIVAAIQARPEGGAQ